MRVFYGCPHSFLRQPTALAIGNFDGVHLGHQALVRRMVEAAHERGLVPSVMTFEPLPKECLKTDAAPLRLSTIYDKAERLKALGVERVYILPFRHIRHLSSTDFIKDILVEKLDTRWVSVGEDFHFGAERSGNIDVLRQAGLHHGFEVEVAPEVIVGGTRVSSSRIRVAMDANDWETVEALLGHRYTMTGRVIYGRQLGRQLGFHTLNVAPMPPASHARPAAHGVFAVRVMGLESTPLPGVASLGVKPTVATDGRYLLETHVFDWSGLAYGHLVQVEFVEHLRNEQKFESLAALKAQIQADADKARSILARMLV